MLLSILAGFLFGVLAVVGAEAFFLVFAVGHLRRRKRPAQTEAEEDRPETRDLDAEQSLAFLCNKQGIVWVLEPEKVPKVVPNESTTKGAKEQKKKEVVEIFPAKKYAKIRDHMLFLSDPDGPHVTVPLRECTIVAVSASDLSSRKWAKRYPIRLESKKSEIYNGSKVLHIYLDTSWEKESWCKALRLASCPDNKCLKWSFKLTEDFQCYLTLLNAVYPSFLKPSALLGEPSEKTNKIDGSSSKVRLFLKKLAKKSTKSGDCKANSASSSVRGERSMDIRSRSLQDVSLTSGLVKTLSDKTASNSLQDFVQPLSFSSGQSGNKNQIPAFSDTISEEKFIGDEGTLGLNLLFSRLFFDAKRSDEIKTFIKARIQRALSGMRVPSYIGGLTCAGFDIGTLPPYVHSIKVLPVDLNEVWAAEVDLEYSGGILLDIETRLEVCAPELQKGIIGTGLGPSSSEEVTADLLDGIEYYGNQLKGHSGAPADQVEIDEDGDKIDELKQTKSSKWTATYVSRWKAIMHSIADQVSQVPLSLAIKISSLRGTLRLYIKPPPSDQLWFAFTSMPEIAWNLESAVGDRKITSSHVALLIGNRVKAAIRDSVVLPNCECVCIPWMLAEKDDWVPRKVAPFIWVNQEAMDGTESEASSLQSEEVKIKPDGGNQPRALDATSPDNEAGDVKNVIHVQKPLDEALSEITTSKTDQFSSGSSSQSLHSQKSDDLRVPLLRDYETPTSKHKTLDSSDTSPTHLVVSDEPRERNLEDVKPKKIGSRRARMMDIGKKMGEKFEEKRRHIEEKSRHIVEKMRENAKT
ncbi:putative synaptotagmin-like mitochondrial-lipid-binding domain-containing protein [Dioscorea sansibarensis]